MRVFYDFEFVEDGRTIDVISVGMAAENGATYYAVNSGMDITSIQKNRWLMENVVPHLPIAGEIYLPLPRQAPWGQFRLDLKQSHVKPAWCITNEVRDFLAGLGDVELWAWYGADHVALAQLFGRMVDLPATVPMYTNDLMQLWRQLGRPALPPRDGAEHDALADARHNLKMFRHLAGMVEGGATLVP